MIRKVIYIWIAALLLVSQLNPRGAHSLTVSEEEKLSRGILRYIYKQTNTTCTSLAAEFPLNSSQYTLLHDTGIITLMYLHQSYMVITISSINVHSYHNML